MKYEIDFVQLDTVHYEFPALSGVIHEHIVSPSLKYKVIMEATFNNEEDARKILDAFEKGKLGDIEAAQQRIKELEQLVESLRIIYK